MSNWLNAAAATTVVLLAAAPAAEASLLGVKVQGNYFASNDPGTNLFILGGETFHVYNDGTIAAMGNSTAHENGTTVTIKDTVLAQLGFVDPEQTIPNIITAPYTEFGSYSPFFSNRVGVDFTENGLYFESRSQQDSKFGPLGAYTVTLVAQTPGAFNGLDLVSESNFSNELSWSLVGDTITIQAVPSANTQVRSATFAFAQQQPETPTPEPASLALLATGLLGLALNRRRRPAGAAAGAEHLRT
jgi:hypothetical protein